MSNKQANQLQNSITLPVLPGINKDFLGLGHVLEKKRKDRRQIEEKQRIIENRVSYLMKESEKANKSIQDKKNYLNQILQIRRRQQAQRQARQGAKSMRQQQLQRLRQQSQQLRTKHISNKHQALTKLLQKNRNDFMDIKRKSQNSKRSYNQLITHQQQSKMLKYKLVQESKKQGKYKIEQYLKNKNREHIREYQKRMNHQQQKMDRKLSLKQELEKKQTQLLQKLKQSHKYQQQLKLKIEKAHQIQFKQLQKIFLNKKLLSKQTNSGNLYKSSITTRDYNLPNSNQRKSMQKLDFNHQQDKKLFLTEQRNTINQINYQRQDPQINESSKKNNLKTKTKTKKNQKIKNS